MTASPYSVELLSSTHRRGNFACGVESLDRYFRERVTQDVRRRLSACFVAVERQTGEIAGYYTLAQSSIPLGEIGEAVRSKLPPYPLVPATRLGRLAVGLTHRGRGLGGALLFDALERAGRAEIVAYAMVVDAKDADAEAFYRHHGFVPFDSAPKTLYLPFARPAAG